MQTIKTLLFTALITSLFFSCSIFRTNMESAPRKTLAQHKVVAVLPIEIILRDKQTGMNQLRVNINEVVNVGVLSNTGFQIEMLGTDSKMEVREIQDVLVEMINREFLGRGYMPIERTRVASILNEQSLELAGVTESSSDITQIGKLVSADAVFSSKLVIVTEKGLVKDNSEITFNGRLVSVKTGSILLSGETIEVIRRMKVEELEGVIEDAFRGIKRVW